MRSDLEIKELFQGVLDARANFSENKNYKTAIDLIDASKILYERLALPALAESVGCFIRLELTRRGKAIDDDISDSDLGQGWLTCNDIPEIDRKYRLSMLRMMLQPVSVNWAIFDEFDDDIDFLASGLVPELFKPASKMAIKESELDFMYQAKCFYSFRCGMGQSCESALEIVASAYGLSPQALKKRWQRSPIGYEHKGDIAFSEGCDFQKRQQAQGVSDPVKSFRPPRPYGACEMVEHGCANKNFRRQKKVRPARTIS